MAGYKITKQEIKPIGNLTYREAIKLTFVAMETFSKQAIVAFEKSISDKTDEEKEDMLKQFKDSLHDEIVVFCSTLAESISPSVSSVSEPQDDSNKQEQA